MIKFRFNLIYILAIVLLFVSIFTLPNNILAAESSATPPSIESLIKKDGGSGRVMDVSKNTDVIPQIYITDISIDSVSYNAGGNVKGTFVIKNTSSFNVSDVGYEIDLSGDFQDNGIPKRTYTIQSSKEPVFLSANEEKKISFSYALPPNLGGKDFGFLIQSKSKSGFNFGWSVSPHFDIIGGHPYVALLYSSVDTSDVEYLDYKAHGLQDGPTVYKDKAPQLAFVRFTLENKSKESISVTPHIKIFERDLAGKQVHDKLYIESKTTITPNTNSGDISIDLPNFEYKPGIYAGVVTFEDEMGNERADRMHFRYIVGGDVFNIEALSSTKNEVKKGESFDLSLIYTGTPFDVNATSHPDVISQVAEVSVVVFDERDRKVAETTANINFQENEKHIFSVVALRSAKAMRAEVKISRNGEVIGASDFILSPNYAEIKKQSQFFSLKNIIYILIGLIIIFCAWMFIRNKKSKNILPTLVAIAFVSGGVFVVLPSPAEAFVVTYQYTSGCSGAYYPPPIYMSSPYPGQVFAKGQGIYVSGSSVYHVCNNSSSNFYASVWNWDGSQYQQALIGSAGEGYCTYRYYKNRSWHTNRIQCNSHYDKQSYFGFNLTAPSVGGYYKAWVRVDNYNGCAHDVTQGYEDYTVREDGVCGAANGAASSNAPSSNLCNPGSASTVSLSGNNWTWACSGAGGGSNASCTAPAIISGTCGTADGVPSETTPSSNLCNPGTASTVTSSGNNWTWTCAGANGGSNSSCTAPAVVNGTCGSANGVASYDSPSSNLCSKGTASTVSSSGNNWTWGCAGINGGSDNNSCSAPTKIDGQCSTTNGQCEAGSPSGTQGSWTCFGVNGGGDAQCVIANCNPNFGSNNCSSQVVLGGISIIPPLVNYGSQCNVNWKSSFVSYDSNTYCTVTNDKGEVKASFYPINVSSAFSYSDAVVKDTIYNLKCWEDLNGNGSVDTGGPGDESSSVINKDGVCRVNFKSGEFN